MKILVAVLVLVGLVSCCAHNAKTPYGPPEPHPVPEGVKTVNRPAPKNVVRNSEDRVLPPVPGSWEWIEVKARKLKP